MDYGAPDGHGQYGMVDDDGHTVLCHDCGQRKRNLGLHARVHGHTAVTYRAAHGLSTGQRLIPTDLAEQLGELSRNSATGLAALAAHRDPDRARAANTADAHQRTQRREQHRQVGRTSRLGRPLTTAEIGQLAAAGSLAEWSRIARHLTTTGASVRGIAAAVGISPATAAARLARLAPID